MLKTPIRHYVIDTLSLFAISQITQGIVFENGLTTILLAGVGLTLISILGKPVINLLLLPLNLVTFGFFSWVSSAIALYLVTLVIPGFKVTKFFFAGLSSTWVDIPQINLEGALAYIAFAFILSLITSVIYWVFK